MAFTQLAWFRAASGATGGILTFTNNTNPANASNYDRHLWIDSTGHLVAGVYPGSVQEATSTTVVTDNAWHLATVTLSSAGLKLYVDGTLEATNIAATTAQLYNGWWSIGAARLAGWSDAPPLTSSGIAYLTGSLAGVAILPTGLTSAQVEALYTSTSFSAYETAVSSYNPIASWALDAATQAGCTDAFATVSATTAGQTTCLAPAGAGACPSPSASDTLASLATPAITANALPSGLNVTVTINSATSPGTPSALSGADLVTTIDIEEVNSGFTATTQITGAQTQI